MLDSRLLVDDKLVEALKAVPIDPELTILPRAHGHLCNSAGRGRITAYSSVTSSVIPPEIVGGPLAPPSPVPKMQGTGGTLGEVGNV
jgi:hypothetical protein